MFYRCHRLEEVTAVRIVGGKSPITLKEYKQCKQQWNFKAKCQELDEIDKDYCEVASLLLYSLNKTKIVKKKKKKRKDNNNKKNLCS